MQFVYCHNQVISRLSYRNNRQDTPYTPPLLSFSINFWRIASLQSGHSLTTIALPHRVSPTEVTEHEPGY
jgi:hypothetical protein